MPDKYMKSTRGDLHPETKIALTVPRTKNAIHDLICLMLSHQRLPTLCCRGQGHFIPKPSVDQRLVHARCPFSKDFMREVYSDSTRHPLTSATVGTLDGGAKARSYNRPP